MPVFVAERTFEQLSLDQRQLGESVIEVVAQSHGGKGDAGIRKIEIGKGHEVVCPFERQLVLVTQVADPADTEPGVVTESISIQVFLLDQVEKQAVVQ